MFAAALVVRTISRAQDKPSVRSVARRAWRAMVSVLVMTPATTLVWLLITSVRSSPAVGESYFYLLCLVGAGAAATARLNTPPSKSADRMPGGFSVLWVVLGLLKSVGAPGFSYLFVWPAFAAALAGTRPREEPGWAATLRSALVVGPTVILLVPAIEFFYQFGQPRPGNPDSSIPSVAAVAFLLIALASGLIQPFFNSRPYGQRQSPSLVDLRGSTP